MSPNRIVAMLTPVFAAAGACATWLAEHFPGINVSASALNEIFIAGALAVLAPALQWLYGWQKFESREAEAQIAAEKAESGVPDVAVQVTHEEEPDEDFADLDLGADDDLDDELAAPRPRTTSRSRPAAEGARDGRREAIQRLQAGGIKAPETAIEEATRAGLKLAFACALLEKESAGGNNVFGHDRDKHGQYIFPARDGTVPVTEALYREYKKRRKATGKMQGVGPCQLTWWEFQDEADREGGCWKPHVNMRVGFRRLAALMKQHGVADGARRYNGSGDAAVAYSEDLRKKARAWEARLEGAPMPAAPRVLRRGDEGRLVEQLTKRLSYVRRRGTREAYLDGKRTRLDAEAEAAVKVFQRDHGLTAGGWAWWARAPGSSSTAPCGWRRRGARRPRRVRDRARAAPARRRARAEAPPAEGEAGAAPLASWSSSSASTPRRTARGRRWRATAAGAGGCSSACRSASRPEWARLSPTGSAR